MLNRIKEIRLAKNMSQTDVARKVGITRQYLFQLEKNEKLPTIKIAFNIADVLGENIYDIFYEDKSTQVN